MLTALSLLACHASHPVPAPAPSALEASFGIDTCAWAPATREELGIEGPGPSGWVRVTLTGSGFFVSAMDPEITIGDVPLGAFEIRNQQTIVGYLRDPPPSAPAVMEYHQQVTASPAPCEPTE